MAKELGNIHKVTFQEFYSHIWNTETNTTTYYINFKEYWHVLEISEALEYGDLFHIFIIYSITTVLPESYRNFKNLPIYHGTTEKSILNLEVFYRRNMHSEAAYDQLAEVPYK
ncbi:unnamed protein product [Rhizophagus irregularis]|nr:unnamed protein product [Rhizophagus irregularis]